MGRADRDPVFVIQGYPKRVSIFLHWHLKVPTEVIASTTCGRLVDAGTSADTRPSWVPAKDANVEGELSSYPRVSKEESNADFWWLHISLQGPLIRRRLRCMPIAFKSKGVRPCLESNACCISNKLGWKVGCFVGRMSEMMTAEANSKVVRGRRRHADEHSNNITDPRSRVCIDGESTWAPGWHHQGNLLWTSTEDFYQYQTNPK
jgi:hypothetical protein